MADQDHARAVEQYNSIIDQYLAENARLKAEVELWKLRSDNWQKFCELTRPEMTDELTRLKAEVERLTKAGDLLCRMAGNNQVINRHWKTAKKGVQS
jgi:hypothetical protein